MIEFIVRSIDSNKTKKSYGYVCSIMGIVINILLALFKLLIGTISNSISIVADSINNISDVASSVITFASFKISSKPADKEHPFGHARAEYAASLVVALIIFGVGFNLIISSIDKILDPGKLEINTIVYIVLIVSILAKIYMYLYNHKYSKKLNSSVMNATAKDSINDVFATSAVLISIIVYNIYNINLDGYLGIIVSISIIITGYTIVKETLDNLIGYACPEEVSNNIKDKILAYDGIIGIHNLMVHCYGSDIYYASVHAEVNCNVDVMISHELLDSIERDLLTDLNVHLVIHMDPINIDDPLTTKLRKKVTDILEYKFNEFEIHDFRIVEGNKVTNLIFDLVLPFNIDVDIDKIDTYLSDILNNKDMMYYCIIDIHRK